MKIVLSFFLCFSLCCSVVAQSENEPVAASNSEAQTSFNNKSEIEKLEDTLGVLSYAIINAASPEQRFMACRSFIPTLTKALKTPNSFDHHFERLKSISIQYPQDSSFRVFTWQLYVDTSEYRYYGAIQMNTPELQLIPLIDRSFQMEDLEHAIVDNKNWYGALYYNIIDFDTPKGKKYLLFGYDGYENFERYGEGNRNMQLAFSHDDFQQYSKRKLIDVLTIEDGKAIFGAPVFVQSTKNGLAKSRIVLQYSAEAKIVCNYDEFENYIIFDHLMAMGGDDIPGVDPIKIPDGTFEGYQLQNGVWTYIPKMFNTVVEEAPRDTPVLDKGSKDILGRKQEKQ